MVTIPAGEFDFQVQGIEIEGSNEIGVDVQYPWENSPRRNHHHTLHIKSFHMDRYPVTNAEFKKFMDATKYLPKDDHNFLKDWKNGTYPAGWENKPVTWVSLEDARAYAAWAGKRLPHEWEWQYAAQGTDGRTYPWGNSWDAQAVPVPEKGHDLPGPNNVDAHPKGASPFGVMDLVGNVWQWTDEYLDEHTARRNPARRKLLSTTRFDVVLSAGLPVDRARQAAADGAQQGSRGHPRVPLRGGCAVAWRANGPFVKSRGSSHHPTTRYSTQAETSIGHQYQLPNGQGVHSPRDDARGIQ